MEAEKIRGVLVVKGLGTTIVECEPVRGLQ